MRALSTFSRVYNLMERLLGQFICESQSVIRFLRDIQENER